MAISSGYLEKQRRLDEVERHLYEQRGKEARDRVLKEYMNMAMRQGLSYSEALEKFRPGSILYGHPHFDPGHTHGNELQRAPTTAPKNEIPDEVLLLLEV